MTIDVIDLRDFYSRRLGIVARQMINRGIRERWPDAEGQRVLGIGYPTPYLGLFREDAERCIAFMPAAQGVLKWPTGRPALASLVDEFSLPLPDAAVDRILLVHALEMSDDPEALLARGLAGAVAVRPRDRGDPEPARRVDAHRQHAVRSRPALFALADHAAAAPDLVHADRLGRGAVHAAVCRRLGAAIGAGVGACGAALSLPFAGVHIVEATKQVYRAIPAKRERARLIPSLKPVLVPSSTVTRD